MFISRMTDVGFGGGLTRGVVSDMGGSSLAGEEQLLECEE